MFARKLTDDELTKTSTIRGGKANSISSMPYGRAELIEPGSEPHNTRTLGPITTQVFTGAEAAAALEISRTAPTIGDPRPPQKMGDGTSTHGWRSSESNRHESSDASDPSNDSQTRWLGQNPGSLL